MAGPNKRNNQQKIPAQPPTQLNAEMALEARKEDYKRAQDEFAKSRTAFDTLLAEYKTFVNTTDPNKQQSQQKYIDFIAAEIKNISDSKPNVIEPQTNDQAEMLIKTTTRLSNTIGAIGKELESKIAEEKQAQLERPSKAIESPPEKHTENPEATPAVSTVNRAENDSERELAKSNFKTACNALISAREETRAILNNISDSQASKELNIQFNNNLDNYKNLMEVVSDTKIRSSKDFNEWGNKVTQFTAEMREIKDKANTIAQQSETTPTPIASASVLTSPEKRDLSSFDPPKSLINAKSNFLKSRASIHNARKEFLEIMKQVPDSQNKTDLLSQHTNTLNRYEELLIGISSKKSPSSNDYERWQKFVDRYTEKLRELNTQGNQLLSKKATEPSSLQARTNDVAPTPAQNEPEQKKPDTTPAPPQPTERIKQCKEKLLHIEKQISEMETKLEAISDNLIGKDKTAIESSISSLRSRYTTAKDKADKFNSLRPRQQDDYLKKLDREITNLEGSSSTALSEITQQGDIARAKATFDSSDALLAGNKNRYEEVQHAYQQYTEVAEQYSDALEKSGNNSHIEAFKKQREALENSVNELKEAYEKEPRSAIIVDKHLTLSKSLPAATARLSRELGQLQAEISTPPESQNVQPLPAFDELDALLHKLEDPDETKGDESDFDKLLKEFASGKTADGKTAEKDLDDLLGELQAEKPDSQVEISTPSAAETDVASTQSLVAEPNNKAISDLDDLFSELQDEKATPQAATSSPGPSVPQDGKAPPQSGRSELDALLEELSKEPAPTKSRSSTQPNDEDIDELLARLEREKDSGQRSTAGGKSDSTIPSEQRSSTSSQSSVVLQRQQIPLAPELPPHPITHQPPRADETKSALGTAANFGIGVIVPNWIKNVWSRLTSYLPSILRTNPSPADPHSGSSEMHRAHSASSVLTRSSPSAPGEIEKALNKMTNSQNMVTNRSTVSIVNTLSNSEERAIQQDLRSHSAPQPSGIPIRTLSHTTTPAASPRASAVVPLSIGNRGSTTSTQRSADTDTPPESPRSSNKP